MPRETIADILVRRDGMERADAEQEVKDCKADLECRLANGEMPYDICEEWFGLEPDYLDEILPI